MFEPIHRVLSRLCLFILCVASGVLGLLEVDAHFVEPWYIRHGARFSVVPANSPVQELHWVLLVLVFDAIVYGALIGIGVYAILRRGAGSACAW